METTVSRFKTWVNENLPFLAKVYESKYVGMVYDRFGSLPPSQQKQIVLGSLGMVLAGVIGYLLLSYGSLLSETGKTARAREMGNILQQYKLSLADQAPVLEALDRNAKLGSTGQLKQFLTEQGRAAGLSPQNIQVEEREAPKNPGAQLGSDVSAKQAVVVLERVNLAQLKTFLTQVEFGDYTLGVPLLRILNDPKTRGYMKAELQVMAYVFQGSPVAGGP